MTIFIIVASLLVLLIFITFILLLLKLNKESVVLKTETIRDILDERAFYPSEIFVVNSRLIVAINKFYSKLAIIQNYNPKLSSNYEYHEIALSFVEKIEKSNFSIKLHYTERAEKKVLYINSITKELKDFFHRIYRNSVLKKIENKFPNAEFTLCASSDWGCNFVWTYGVKGSVFAYSKIADKPMIHCFNIRKKHFTIDTKYKYFEAPIMGVAQQLFVFEKDFLSDLYELLFESIKEKTIAIIDNEIYYDSYNNIVYLTNGVCSLQSVLLNEVEEVYYRDNRISFSLFDQQRQINFISNPQLAADFREFMTNYNLRQIADSFNYKTDKLINATQNTKFIFDSTRNRIVYCTNFDRVSSFRYMAISFDSLKSVSVEKSGLSSFVRINTVDKQTLDVTCDKKEVALYIEAQLKKVI